MRVKQGIVTSDRMSKTIVIVVHTYKRHPKYLKRRRISKKFYVDDPEEKCKIGQEVIITETKPKSKLKKWKVLKILS